MVLIDQATTDTFTVSNGFFIHQYSVVGTRSISVFDGGNLEVLVVAGGGGGGTTIDRFAPSGGGGGGEVVYLTSHPVSGGSLTVTIGAGGSSNVNGSTSVFGNIQANGGGAGAPGGNSSANSGGSGGGGGRYTGTRATSVKLHPSGLGNAGGLSTTGDGAGGGGAAAQGGARVGAQGFSCSITGTAQIFGSGGGGGSRAGGGSVGGTNAGSGGAGETNNATIRNASNAVNGFGGGGGGGGCGGNFNGLGNGGAGGSGIVILKYYIGNPIYRPVSWTAIRTSLNTTGSAFSSYLNQPVNYVGLYQKLPTGPIAYSNFLGRAKTITNTGLALSYDPANVNSYSGSGTTLTDLSGNNRNGTLSGGASVNANKQIVLNDSPQFVSTAFQVNLDNSTLYTFELWFWDDAVGVPDNTALISNYTGNANTVPNTQFHVFNDGTVRILERNTSSQVGSAATSTSVCTGTWTHLAAVATSTQLILYVNGVSVATGTRPGGIITPSPNRAISIGGNHFDRYQTCRLGPIRVYIGKALTAAEVVGNYEAERYRESLNK